MGNLIHVPVWRKKRKATEELDEIAERLSELEARLKANLENRARYLQLLLYVTLFLLTVSSAYLWLRYRDLKSRALLFPSIVLISFSVFLLLRLVIVSIFNYLINRNKKSIHYYTERKIAIIEDVKENEKFKVAKEIIEKYAPKEELLGVKEKEPRERSKSAEQATPPSNGQTLPQTKGSPKPATPPQRQSGTTPTSNVARMPRLNEIGEGRFRREPIRPFIEKSDNVIDRLLDYVMGESIANRYALICAKCKGHNGMALREEFEQIAYHCYRCNTYNPSRNELKTLAQHQANSPRPAEKDGTKDPVEFYSLTPKLPDETESQGSSGSSSSQEEDGNK